VQKNDVVILGSDGVWDNLFEQQIIEIVSSVQKAGGGPEVLPFFHNSIGSSSLRRALKFVIKNKKIKNTGLSHVGAWLPCSY
jgi:serine/threonine protein phosphatase PrpC